jgi:hypothetical protein
MAGYLAPGGFLPGAQTLSRIGDRSVGHRVDAPPPAFSASDDNEPANNPGRPSRKHQWRELIR